MNQIIKFLNFQFRAKNKHGIHSPFVFALMENVIEDKRWFYAFDEIEQLRYSLKRKNISIPVYDLGAGSKFITKEKHEVELKKILSTSVSNRYKSRVLFRLIEYLNLKNGIELGTSAGISSAYLSKACSPGILYSLEANRGLCNIAIELHTKLKIFNCHVINSEFDSILIDTLEKLPNIDFAFIDGNHEYDATLRYFTKILHYTQESSIIIIDDIYWSKGMHKAWNEIKKNEKVSLSIDLFYFGVVFLAPDFKVKQNFKLKSPITKIMF